MSGLREAIMENEPILFYTFDGENYVEPGGHLSDESLKEFTDSMGHKNAIIVDTLNMECPWHGYKVQPSLCELEPYSNAMAFGYDGYYLEKNEAGNITNWYTPNSYMEIPHSQYTTFPNNQMCIELLFKIVWMKNAQFGNATTYGWLFSKSGLITAQIISSSTRYYLRISTAAGEAIDIDVSQGRIYHLVVNYAANGGLEVYLDCIDMADHRMSLPENQHNRPKTLNVASPLFFGSIPGDAKALRRTEGVVIDYVAIYDYFLPEAEIVRHHKKIRTYWGMCKHHGARQILPLDDQITPDNKLTEYGKTEAAARHDSSCQMRIPGPDAIPQSYGITNPNRVPTMWGQLEMRFMTGTLEFWFMLGPGSQRECIFHTDNGTFPSRGLQIWANSHNNGYMRNSIEFVLNDNKRFSTSEKTGINWCDGTWHHCAIVTQNDKLKVYIDMVEYEWDIGEGAFPYLATHNWAFGCSRNTGYSTVAISNFAIYWTALNRFQINTHYTYGIINRIRGIITLQGIPIAANIRAYNHNTGKLVYTTISDPVTGEYEMSLLDNSRIDLMVFDMKNENIRYRAVGPIEPDKYIDIPFLL